MEDQFGEILEDNNALSGVIFRCPNCKSENTSDVSIRKQNSHRRKIGDRRPKPVMPKILDIRACDDCGIVFKPVKGNGL